MPIFGLGTLQVEEMASGKVWKGVVCLVYSRDMKDSSAAVS